MSDNNKKEFPDNLIEFAACPIQVKPKEDIIHFVDSVIDSSRYFVIRFLSFIYMKHFNCKP